MKIKRIGSIFAALEIVLLISAQLLSCENLDSSYTDTIAPAHVTALTAGNCDGSVVLSWTDPKDKDLSTILITCNGTSVSVAAGTDTYTWSGLTNGTTYTFYVYAVDKNGNTSTVKSVVGVPVSIASLSMSNVIVHPGDTAATITWTDPSYDLLQVKVSGDTITTQYVAKGTGYCTITGLTNETSYTVNVTPVDSTDNTKTGSATAVTITPQTISGTNADDWILVYFKSDSSPSVSTTNIAYNSLWLGSSTDGVNYTALADSPVLTIGSTIGNGGQCIRDPYIIRKNDGTFVMLATDWTPFGGSISTTYTSTTTTYWSTVSPCLVIADSKDLITWTNERCINVAKLSSTFVTSRGSQMHAWAPEAFWDSSLQKYGVIWSGNGSLTDSSDTKNRTYVSYTTDFTTFEDPVLYFEYDVSSAAVSEIDATMAKSGSTYYMFFKDEGSGKDIIGASSSSLDPQSFTMLNNGEYVTRTTSQNTSQGVEGPFVVQVGSTWWLFVDHYGSTSTTSTSNFYGYSTTDMSSDPSVSGNWTQHANDGTYSFPAGVRHGNTVRVTAAELAALQSAW
jgi:hypothetical protein